MNCCTLELLMIQCPNDCEYINYNVRAKILLHLLDLFIATRDDVMTFVNIPTVS